MKPTGHNQNNTTLETTSTHPDSLTKIVVTDEVFAGHPCIVAEPQGCQPAAGLLVALDGKRLIRRIERLVEQGEVDASRLPRIVGIDTDDALRDYTPWWHPAFKEGADDFGGGADDFLEKTVLPVAAQARGAHNRISLMGYSLAGLFCLHALTRTDSFDEYLIASPSSWYPGFVNKLARSTITSAPRVIVACGRDEGLDHPEPIRGICQDTERAVRVLTEKLDHAPLLLLDDFDHHVGLPARIKALLARFE